jgi:hypothetical protein
VACYKLLVVAAVLAICIFGAIEAGPYTVRAEELRVLVVPADL